MLFVYKSQHSFLYKYHLIIYIVCVAPSFLVWFPSDLNENTPLSKPFNFFYLKIKKMGNQFIWSWSRWGLWFIIVSFTDMRMFIIHCKWFKLIKYCMWILLLQMLSYYWWLQHCNRSYVNKIHFMIKKK